MTAPSSFKYWTGNRVYVLIQAGSDIDIRQCDHSEKMLKNITLTRTRMENHWNIPKEDKRPLIEGAKDLLTAGYMPSLSAPYFVKPVFLPPTFKMVCSLGGHEGAVWPVLALPDGGVASGCEDQKIRMWNEKFELERVVQGSGSPVYSLAVLENQRLLSGGGHPRLKNDYIVRRWDDTFTRWKACIGHTERIYSLCPIDNPKFFSGSRDGTIRLWHAWSLKCEKILKGHAGPIYSLLYLPKMKLLVSASEDKTLKVWDGSQDWLCVETLKGHTAHVSSIAQLTEEMVVSGSHDKTLRVWRRQKKFECIAVLTGHTGSVCSVAVLQEGLFASGSGDKTVRIWNTYQNFSCIHVLSGHTNTIWSMARLKNGMLATGCCDGMVRIWDTRIPEQPKLPKPKPLDEKIQCVVCSKDLFSQNTALSIPCAHETFHLKCVKGLKECPVCKKGVRGYMKIYH